jgi:hypothetical protein
MPEAGDFASLSCLLVTINQDWHLIGTARRNIDLISLTINLIRFLLSLR